MSRWSYSEPGITLAALRGSQLSAQVAVSEQRMPREPAPPPQDHNQEAAGPGAVPSGPRLGQGVIRMLGAEVVADGEDSGQPLATAPPARTAAETAREQEEKTQLRAAIKACLADISFHGKCSLGLFQQDMLHSLSCTVLAQFPRLPICLPMAQQQSWWVRWRRRGMSLRKSWTRKVT